MPSDALNTWRIYRIPRLQEIEADCLHLQAMHGAASDRAQAYIRAYAVLLCSEFQGYCRELHNECADILVAAVVPFELRAVLRGQCLYGRKLDTGNPNVGNLGADFTRYGLDFWPAVMALDPAHVARQHRLAMLNAWRNAIAHHDYDPAELGGTITLTIPQVRDWRLDCDAFAAAFDAVMYHTLQTILGTPPWAP